VTLRQLKFGYFTLEALNSAASTFFLYYLFFLTRDEFRFTSRDNLFLTALHGGVYLIASWRGGKFAQRFGYFTALKLGFGGMIVALGGRLFGAGCCWPIARAGALDRAAVPHLAHARSARHRG